MKKISRFLIAIILGFSFNFAFNSLSAQAASYSASEAKLVRKFQTEYHKLDRTSVYDQNNIYVVKPVFASPFNPGVLNKKYIVTSMAYINYYRSLFGLPSELNPVKANQTAQVGAGVLAALNAKTSLRAHGLIGYKRPSYVSSSDWSKAENSTMGNINFLESTTGATAGEIVTDLLEDVDNIAGSGNTGHRALILSARATKMGIGAAYGKSNGKFYSVEHGIFADDILRRPVKNVVSYPASGVFSYELTNNHQIPWSIYFANKRISRTPRIYITDLTSHKTYRAIQVRNYGTDYYGSGYSSALTFKPSSSLKIINTHKYQVKIDKIYTYSFRLFRQNSTLKEINYKSTKRASKRTKVTHKRNIRKKNTHKKRR